jgi:DNA-binding XRE family transcriptional regulator
MIPFENTAMATVAKEAARMALQEYRVEQKRGRRDAGTGSEKLGEILRTSRGTRYTQEELAELAGLHPTTIGKIETGDRGMSLHTFCRLAQAFANDGDEDFAWRVVEYFWHE